MKDVSNINAALQTSVENSSFIQDNRGGKIFHISLVKFSLV